MSFFEVWRISPEHGEQKAGTLNTRRAAKNFINDSEHPYDRHAGVKWIVKEVRTDGIVPVQQKSIFNTENPADLKREKKRLEMARYRAKKRENVEFQEQVKRFNPPTIEEQISAQTLEYRKSQEKLAKKNLHVFDVEDLKLLKEYCRFSRKEWERFAKFTGIVLFNVIDQSNNVLERIEENIKIQNARRTYSVPMVEPTIPTVPTAEIFEHNLSEIEDSEIEDLLANWNSENGENSK